MKEKEIFNINFKFESATFNNRIFKLGMFKMIKKMI